MPKLQPIGNSLKRLPISMPKGVGREDRKGEPHRHSASSEKRESARLQEEMDVTPGQPEEIAERGVKTLQKKRKSMIKKQEMMQGGSEPAEERLDKHISGAGQSEKSSEGPDGPSSSGRGEVDTGQDGDEDNGVGEDEEAEGARRGEKRVRKAGSKKLSKEKLEKLKEKFRKRGVVYVSRIPPHLKPLKLRHMLEPFGEVLRIYLAPEDTAIRARRKRAGGDSGKNFTEG